MDGPAKNRLHGYEVGWFTLLRKMEVATEQQLRAAQARVARAEIERMEAQRERRRSRRNAVNDVPHGRRAETRAQTAVLPTGIEPVTFSSGG